MNSKLLKYGDMRFQQDDATLLSASETIQVTTILIDHEYYQV